jgi:hypothetical protein
MQPSPIKSLQALRKDRKLLHCSTAFRPLSKRDPFHHYLGTLIHRLEKVHDRFPDLRHSLILVGVDRLLL